MACLCTFCFQADRPLISRMPNPLLDKDYVPCLHDSPRKPCPWLLADKGYDDEALPRCSDRYRTQPVIPLRSMQCKPKPGFPHLFDCPNYQQRNIIERLFG